MSNEKGIKHSNIVAQYYWIILNYRYFIQILIIVYETYVTYNNRISIIQTNGKIKNTNFELFSINSLKKLKILF